MGQFTVDDPFCYNSMCIHNIYESVPRVRRLYRGNTEYQIIRHEYIRNGKSIFFCSICHNVFILAGYL